MASKGRKGDSRVLGVFLLALRHQYYILCVTSSKHTKMIDISYKLQHKLGP